MSRVAPAESDLTVSECYQPMIGNGYPMGIASQIAQGMFCSAERALGIDHPIGTEQRTQHGGECLGRLKRDKRTVKTEPSGSVKLAQARHEFAAEHAAEDLHRQEEVVPCGNPAGVVRGQAAGRYDTVDMRVMKQLLIPGMQYAEEPDLRAQVARMAGDLEQGFGAGPK